MTRNKITKGMILAAGLGTRLRPLTDKTPKPLIEVGGKKIIEYSIDLLVKVGIHDIIINLHHLGDQIKSCLGDGARYGAKFTYSFEPKILGTGGGIKKAEDFFNGEPFVAINGDVITDIDLKRVIKFHQGGGFNTSLVLRPLCEGETYTPIETDGDLLIGFDSGNKMYTGIQIIDPSILKALPKKTFLDIVSSCFIPLLKKGGKIGAYIFAGYWDEIGTQERLNAVRKNFSDK